MFQTKCNTNKGNNSYKVRQQQQHCTELQIFDSTENPSQVFWGRSNSIFADMMCTCLYYIAILIAINRYCLTVSFWNGTV